MLAQTQLRGIQLVRHSAPLVGVGLEIEAVGQRGLGGLGGDHLVSPEQLGGVQVDVWREREKRIMCCWDKNNKQTI
jgi:hypothetical protein